LQVKQQPPTRLQCAKILCDGAGYFLGFPPFAFGYGFVRSRPHGFASPFLLWSDFFCSTA
jgi:hypothetical protein